MIAKKFRVLSVWFELKFAPKPLLFFGMLGARIAVRGKHTMQALARDPQPPPESFETDGGIHEVT